jgi:hypothetical protein
LKACLMHCNTLPYSCFHGMHKKKYKIGIECDSILNISLVLCIAYENSQWMHWKVLYQYMIHGLEITSRHECMNVLVGERI